MSNEFGVGRFQVEVVGSYVGKSRQKGTPELSILFQDEEGRRIWARRYFTAGSFKILRGELTVMGWDPAEHDYDYDQLDQKQTEDGVIEKPSVLRGAKVEIVTKEESWTDENGAVQTGTKVAFINRIGGGRPPELPAEERQGFLDQLRKQSMAWDGPQSAPRTRKSAASAEQQQAQGEDFDFSEIPF